MKPMIFLNVGWMQKYQGLAGDSITGGGAHVQQHHEGCEIFNFKPYEGYMYGFVRVAGSINIERLGAPPLDNSIDGVLAIWVAKSPVDGTVIVGWYENATVYRDCQPPPEGSGRERKGRREWGYRIIAKAEDCRLLPVDERVFRIPRGGKGRMGRANLWYADQPIHASFRRQVWEYVTQGHSTSTGNRR
jgi:hypothetical protein